jgi:hypothetical protein
VAKTDGERVEYPPLEPAPIFRLDPLCVIKAAFDTFRGDQSEGIYFFLS